MSAGAGDEAAGRTRDASSWSSRVRALPPAKRALLDEMTRRRAEAAARADPLADVTVLRARSACRGDPVVLAHPIGGGLFCYVDLCQALPADLAITGVAAGPALAEPAELTIEQLARHYVARLGAAGVPRPAAVAGWSFGGLLAYEMARQWLEAAGTAVPVVLVDSAPWPRGDPPWDQETTLRTFAEYLLGLAGVAGDSFSGSALWRLPVGQALAGMADRLRELGVDLGFPAAELLRRYWMYANAAAAMCRYAPAPYAGAVSLVRATGSAALAGPWPGGQVRVVWSGGDHYSVLRPPVVARVAEVIAAAVTSRPHDDG